MSKDNLRTITRCSVTLHVSMDVAIFRQCGFWYDTDKVYQFVPCHENGLVVATMSGRDPGSEVLRGWIMHRPKALELSWPVDQVVNMVELQKEYAWVWYHQDVTRWVHLGMPAGEYPKHVVTR